MATIEERAKVIAHKYYKAHGGVEGDFVQVCTEAATEQDRIARQEERERCIEAACNWIKKNTCTIDMEYMVSELHKAMEGGL